MKQCRTLKHFGVNYPPPKGSGFPPMTNERILFMKKIKGIEVLVTNNIYTCVD